MNQIFLEKIDLLKHKLTVEEIDEGERIQRQLAEDCLERRISVKTCLSSIDKLPDVDFRQLAQEIKFKG